MVTIWIDMALENEREHPGEVKFYRRKGLIGQQIENWSSGPVLRRVSFWVLTKLGKKTVRLMEGSETRGK